MEAKVKSLPVWSWASDPVYPNPATMVGLHGCWSPQIIEVAIRLTRKASRNTSSRWARSKQCQSTKPGSQACLQKCKLFTLLDWRGHRQTANNLTPFEDLFCNSLRSCLWLWFHEFVFFFLRIFQGFRRAWWFWTRRQNSSVIHLKTSDCGPMKSV